MKLIIAVATFVQFFSCDKSDKSNFDSTLKVALKQTEEGLVLITETEKLYSTAGYIIKFESNQKQKQIKLTYKKIVSPEPYQLVSQVLSPASCKIPLDLRNLSELDLVFKLDKKKTKGRIIVQNGEANLSINHSNWIEEK